jgi:hypothetical protein
MAKKMIIKGVGTFMAKKAAKDGKGVEVITLGSLQDLRINLNVEIEDIFGGDGLFSIDTLVKSKSIEISATDAKFDLDAVQLMMGSSLQEQVEDYVWVLNEQKVAVAGTNGTTAVAEVVPEFSATIFATDPNFSVRLKDNNKLLTQIAYAADTAPADGEFMFDATAKKLYFAATVENADIVYNYKRTETVDLVDLLVDEVPFAVHVIHHGSFLQKDGTYAGLETELYACRAQGAFSIDAARATASASTVNLKIIDPERADGKLGTMKRYQANTRV